MAKSVVYKRGSGGDIEFNMTPMIDVTFQLILFFILAGQIASTALARMELSKPDTSQALKPEQGDVANKVIINVISKAAVDAKVDPFLAGKVDWYQIGQIKVDVGDEARLIRIIEDARARLPQEMQKDFFVEIRADRRVHFVRQGGSLRAASQKAKAGQCQDAAAAYSDDRRDVPVAAVLPADVYVSRG